MDVHHQRRGVHAGVVGQPNRDAAEHGAAGFFDLDRQPNGGGGHHPGDGTFVRCFLPAKIETIEKIE